MESNLKKIKNEFENKKKILTSHNFVGVARGGDLIELATNNHIVVDIVARAATRTDQAGIAATHRIFFFFIKKMA